MTMHNAHIQKQPALKRKLSRKEIYDKIYVKIANSLAEFNLHGNKFEGKLKKVSKLFAKDISKAGKKKNKSDSIKKN
jgi:hypothetical protein